MEHYVGLDVSLEQNALHTLIRQRRLTPSCGECALPRRRTLGLAGTITESLHSNSDAGFISPTSIALRHHRPNHRWRRDEEKFSLSARNSTEGS
jgi:hypothetical protein